MDVGESGGVGEWMCGRVCVSEGGLGVMQEGGIEGVQRGVVTRRHIDFVSFTRIGK